LFFFFFNDTATTEIYTKTDTLSLHGALPISNPNYAFETAGGRYIVHCFFASTDDDHSRAALAAVRSRQDFFCDTIGSFFGVSCDAGDLNQKRVADSYPGYRYFWDFDGRVSRLYGALPHEPAPAGTRVHVRRMWVVLDPTMRVIRVIRFQPDQSDIGEAMAFIDGLLPPERFAGFEVSAPVLVLPNVFEPVLCRRLVDLYRQHGGEESGFMRDRNGQTAGVFDPSHKRRQDHVITDTALIAECQARVRRRIVPEIRKVHQFHVTRMERYIVAHYAAEDGGHFRPHRDNTTKGTAHRRFAVTINLNDDYDGGDLRFPEYGPRTYRAPVGGAIVFSCSLLHMVTKMTSGERFAFLPFLYDNAAAQLREENSQFLAEGVERYRATAVSPAPCAEPAH